MWLQPIYSLKVTLEIFIHRNSTGILKIIAKGHQVLLYMNGYWHVTSQDWSKRYSFHSKCYFSFLTPYLNVPGSTISTPKSYDEHPRQVKYGSLPPPPSCQSPLSPTEFFDLRRQRQFSDRPPGHAGPNFLYLYWSFVNKGKLVLAGLWAAEKLSAILRALCLAIRYLKYELIVIFIYDIFFCNAIESKTSNRAFFPRS